MNKNHEFLLGASTAAYQVEGNNIYSDFWTLEHLPHTSFTELSGDAVDHYNRFEEDIRMLKEAGFDICLYTGFSDGEVPLGIRKYLTYLKTGEFRLEEKTTLKPFVGSTNQIFRRVA